jgi:hypothetical protein
MKHRCPVCHKSVKASFKKKTEEAKFFPFCSRRCKLIDLGAWLNAEYKIVSGPEPQETGGLSDTSPPSSDKQ